MSQKITTEINYETMLKLERRARRAGMTADQAVKVIVAKGVQFFLALLVDATK